MFIVFFLSVLCKKEGKNLFMRVLPCTMVKKYNVVTLLRHSLIVWYYVEEKEKKRKKQLIFVLYQFLTYPFLV